MSAPDPVVTVPTAPSLDVGSPILADALASGDGDAVRAALALGHVVVPRLVTPEGERQVRVFASGDEQRPHRLYLFSSSETLARFLPDDDEQREYLVTRALELAPVLDRHRASIDLVVLDAAGPAPLSATPEEMLDVFELAARAFVPVAGAETTDVPADVVIGGLELALDDGWTVVDLDPSRRDADIARLVRLQVPTGVVSPELRRELQTALGETAARAESSGARLMAFLTRRTEAAAAAFQVTLYWHPVLGPVGLERVMSERLEPDLGPGDELVEIATDLGPLARHTHTVIGGSDLGMADMPVLSVDYWLESPDSSGLALVAFSSPHVELREQLQRVGDAIVMSSGWLVDPGRDLRGA